MRPTAAVLLALLLAGCGGGTAVSHFGTVVKGREGATAQVELQPGQRFSLAVPDTPAPGDDWRLVEVPDPKVASFISEEQPDEGGTAYFVFNAKRPGVTEVRLRPAPPATQDAVFSVTVRERGRTVP